jgi:hypothetical protein
MPMVPTGFLRQDQLDKKLAAAVRKLGKDVVRVRYTLDDDSTGEPAIYFRIVLTDAASREDKLLDVTERVSKVIRDHVQPYEAWGVYPYFSFRSQSEQDQLNDPVWA